MQSRARLLGHPLHQMLVVFPLGVLTTAVLFDLIAIATDAAVANVVAYWMIAARIVGELLALITAWLGGELVSRLGVGLYEDSGREAPGSLARPARHTHSTD